MQQIVNVTIDSKGNAISDSKSIGLQYETGVTRYAITPDPSWVSDQYFYYIIVSPPEDSDNKQYAVPLVNQGGTFIFEISSGITWHVGNYKFAFLTMSKELVDGQVSKDGIVGISESWNGKITKSILDYIALQKQPADANFQLLYTDLMALSVELRNAINNIDLEGNYAREQGDYAKEQAEYAKEQGDYAKEKGDYANTKAELANTKAEYANTQGNYAKTQGEQAQAKGNKAQEQGNTAQEKAEYATEQGNYAKRVGDTVQGQIDRLRANQVQGSASGTEVVVQDAAEIESVLRVSGNSEQDSRSGKNLLPFTNKTFTLNNMEHKCVDGELILNGTTTAESYNTNSKYKENFAFTLPAGNYILQMREKEALAIGIPTYITKTSDNTQLAIVNGRNILHTSFTLTEETEVYIGFYLYQQTLSNLNLYLMLEEGTVATDYEPYGVQPSPDYPSEIRSVSGDVELKVEGKNKLVKQGLSTPSTDTEFWSDCGGTPLEDGWIRIKKDNSAGTSVLFSNLFIRDKAIVDLKASTRYTIYLEFRNVTINGAVVFALNDGYRNDEVFETYANYQASGIYSGLIKAVKLKTKSDLSNSKLAFRSNFGIPAGGSVDLEMRMMVFEGEYTLDQINGYEPYKGKTISIPLGDIQLRSTPDGTRDTFARVDGKWNKVSNIFREYSENLKVWGLYGTIDSNETYISFVLGSTQKYKGCVGSTLNTLNNMFKWDHRVYYKDAEAYWTLSGNSEGTIYIGLKKERLADVSTAENAAASFKTWLAENPLYVDYVLATPTYTPITDQALISALDQLEQFILHKGYNYITATSVNGVKAQLDLSYIKDINTVLNNLTAMIATIGGEMNV